jgi:hypothetical protein
MYTTEPVLGVKRAAKKGAAHVYLGLWTRRFGNMKVHQLVCEAFHGPKPFDRAVVIHRDEDALNNKPCNLKWGTQKENLNAPGFLRTISARAKAMPRRTDGKGGGFARKVA